MHAGNINNLMYLFACNLFQARRLWVAKLISGTSEKKHWIPFFYCTVFLLSFAILRYSLYSVILNTNTKETNISTLYCFARPNFTSNVKVLLNREKTKETFGSLFITSIVYLKCSGLDCLNTL